MITITSYLHRDRLKNLIKRWMYNDCRSEDAEDIVQLVYFNNAFISRYLPVFSDHVFCKLHDLPLKTLRARLKGDLKNVIVSNVPYHNSRITEMLGNYRATPGLYYRETPFHGTLYFNGHAQGDRYIGSNRIKRVRRLAEKSARRIIDWIYDTIKDRADHLAQERALRLGIEINALVTPAEYMIEEFLKAEARLLDDLRNRRPIRNEEKLVIQDVAGLKVIVEDSEQQRFVDRICEMNACDVIEVEPHTGRYNAVNLIVRYRPDRQRLVDRPLGERLNQLMQARGLTPQEAHRRFREFVLSGEDNVHVEVIVCNYQEMLESEIGRCMHEDRIMRQRLDQQYNGQLARNIEFLMEFLFAFPASAQSQLLELPIQLWNRYLPDYFDEAMKVLFDIPSVEVLE